MYTLRFDGLFRDLPGTKNGAGRAGVMCYGWLIERHGCLVAHGHGAVAHAQKADSNTAEYLALIEGLDALLDMGVSAEAVDVIGDARSVIEQMRGTAAVSSSSVKPLYRRAARLARRLRRVEWLWQPRKYNRQADALTRRAMRQVQHDRTVFLATIQAMQQESPKRFLNLLDLRVYTPGQATAIQ